MSRNNIILSLLILSALAFGFYIYNRIGVFATATAPPTVQIGAVSGIVNPPTPFPSLTIGDVTLPTKNYTLVNLFASWCAPCLVEWPALKELRTIKGLHIIGLGFASDTNLDSFLGQNGNPFNAIGRDDKGDLLTRLNASGLPETYVLNPQGQIIFHRKGALLPDDLHTIRTLIDTSR